MDECLCQQRLTCFWIVDIIAWSQAIETFAWICSSHIWIAWWRRNGPPVAHTNWPFWDAGALLKMGGPAKDLQKRMSPWSVHVRTPPKSTRGIHINKHVCPCWDEVKRSYLCWMSLRRQILDNPNFRSSEACPRQQYKASFSHCRPWHHHECHCCKSAEMRLCLGLHDAEAWLAWDACCSSLPAEVDMLLDCCWHNCMISSYWNLHLDRQFSHLDCTMNAEWATSGTYKLAFWDAGVLLKMCGPAKDLQKQMSPWSVYVHTPQKSTRGIPLAIGKATSTNMAVHAGMKLRDPTYAECHWGGKS